MRPFELLMLAGLVVHLVLFLQGREKNDTLRSVIAGLIALICLVHLFGEGYRWQMVPAYGLVGILIATEVMTVIPGNIFAGVRSRSPGKAWRVVLATIGFLFLITTVFVGSVMPVFHLPAPDGPFPVGTTTLQLTDHSRQEILTDDPDDYRQITVQIWYPAQPSASAQYRPYWKEKLWPECIQTEASENLSPPPPSFIFDHLTQCRSNSFLNVPVSSAQERYPVIVLSPGFLGTMEDHQIKIEHLVSHGYIVMGPDQPFESGPVNRNGTLLPYSRGHLKLFEVEVASTGPLWVEFWSTTDPAERELWAQKILDATPFMDEALRIRSADIRFMINHLQKMQLDTSAWFLARRLDLEQLGIMGHSLGGATSVQVCLEDQRFKAAINMDGFEFGDIRKNSLNQPVLLMESESFSGANDFLVPRHRGGLQKVTFKGSTHMDFSDENFSMPMLRYLKMTGPIDPLTMRKMVNEKVEIFFDDYLR